MNILNDQVYQARWLEIGEVVTTWVNGMNMAVLRSVEFKYGIDIPVDGELFRPVIKLTIQRHGTTPLVVRITMNEHYMILIHDTQAGRTYKTTNTMRTLHLLNHLTVGEA